MFQHKVGSGAFRDEDVVLIYLICTGGGKGSDSDDDEPAAKKKATPALVSASLHPLSQ